MEAHSSFALAASDASSFNQNTTRPMEFNSGDPAGLKEGNLVFMELKGA